MSGKNQTDNFGILIQKEMTKDLDALTSALATHIDEFVIDAKFREGFPGHSLTKRTIQRKGHNRVGEDTGALRKAATLFTNWSLWPSVLGTNRPASQKKRHGLTAYANMVKTKAGGTVDYLALTSNDKVNLQNFIKSKMQAKQYMGSFSVVIREKEAGEE